MKSLRRGIAREFGPTLALAGPVVAAELGWMAMGIVDTMIVGRLGAEAIGAVGIGSTLFLTVAVFGMGMLLGLDTLVAQAFGAGRLDDGHRALVQGIYLGLALAPMVMGLVVGAIPWLDRAGVHPTVLRPMGSYLRAVAWSAGPLLVFAALRRYLQAMGRVAPILVALVAANAINALANWVLVFGRLGAPALGVEGSGWATTLARTAMTLMLLGDVLLHEWRHPTGLLRTPLRPDPARLARLIGLGTPAAVHVTLEVGVFALATTLVGRLGPIPLAAHQIVLNVASLTFMIPLGLASAAAVRVGHALGRRDPESATYAGWTAILLGAGFMATSGLTFLTLPGAIMGRFTTDPEVVATGLSLLGVAACFQLFDGLQGVTTGVLRGLGDTRTPMLCNLLAHWCLGLPVGSALAFAGGWGVLGLWVGLSLGLTVAGIILLRAWVLQARALRADGSSLRLGCLNPSRL